MQVSEKCSNLYKIFFYELFIFILEMSIDQIMNGAPEFKFPGLLNLVQDYLRNIEVETDTMCTLSRYWIYLQKKCTGQLMTNARYIRNFVTQVYSKCLTMLV